MMLCRALICLGAVGTAIMVDSKEVRSLIDVEGPDGVCCWMENLMELSLDVCEPLCLWL